MSALTIRHARLFCPDAETMASRLIDDATVEIEGGRIRSVQVNAAATSGGDIIDAGGRLLTPGLVDCHTHLLFLGDRAGEFCERAAGASYLEIAQKGGGIRATVGPTRAGPAELRVQRARTRLQRLLSQGVTSVEVKSGYGLSFSHEIEHLREINSLNAIELPRVFPTLMAAHAIPPEVTDASLREAWVTEIIERLIPAVANERVAQFVDVFVETTAYTLDEAKKIVQAAQAHGLGVHLHVDQLSAMGSTAYVSFWAVNSVAHLERITELGIRGLGQSKTIAVLLPTATFTAGEPQFAPARRLIEAGVRIALSTNVNPGTAPTESTSLMFFLSAVGLHMTPEEILWASTRGGALALGQKELGLIEVGAPADLVLWNASDPAHLPYHAAVNHVRTVLKAGAVVLDRSAEADASCDGML